MIDGRGSLPPHFSTEHGQWLRLVETLDASIVAPESISLLSFLSVPEELTKSGGAGRLLGSSSLLSLSGPTGRMLAHLLVHSLDIAGFQVSLTPTCALLERIGIVRGGLAQGFYCISIN